MKLIMLRRIILRCCFINYLNELMENRYSRNGRFFHLRALYGDIYQDILSEQLRGIAEFNDYGYYYRLNAIFIAFSTKQI